MKRWMEYFSELLNSDPPPPTAAPVDNIQPEWYKLDIIILSYIVFITRLVEITSTRLQTIQLRHLKR